MTSLTAALASRKSKRRANEELDAPASKTTRREDRDEKDRLNSKLEEALDCNLTWQYALQKLDNIAALEFYDTETKLQREDAEQLAVYLKVCTGSSYQD
jgi:hypothetical protein